MARFTDSKGREWTVELTVGDLDSLKRAGMDIDAAYSEPEKFVGMLTLDPATLVRGLWEILAEQATAKQIDPIAFARGFTGPVITAAKDALIAAIVDFYQRPAVAAAMNRKLPLALKKAEEAMIAAIEANSFEPAGNSPESSESIPAH